MADYLQSPPKSTLRKRKSDNDLSQVVTEERRAVLGAVLQRKDNWVCKEIRQRSRYYCCHCCAKQALEKGGCTVCGHETTDCSECLAGRTSGSSSSNGKVSINATALQGLLSQREQLQPRQEKPQQKLDDVKFDVDRHLIFSPPQNTWSLEDMELQYDDSVTTFAVSGNFPLFSVQAIAEMQRELLNDKVRQKFRKTSTIVNYQLRGMVPDHAEFTYNTWSCTETLAAISKVVGTDLIPVMDLEISHVNILSSSKNDHHPIQWHRDDYPYVCVLMLSDTKHMKGGEVLMRTGTGGIIVGDSPKIGFAYILHGRHIEHAVNSFRGCTDRITAVTALRPRSPFVQNQTRLYNVLAVSDHPQLSYQFVQYRWRIIIERLAALRQLLKGEEVRWSRGMETVASYISREELNSSFIIEEYNQELNRICFTVATEVLPTIPYRSTLLADNVEGAQRFLQDTSIQVGMTSPTYTARVSSNISAFEMRVGYPAQYADQYDIGLCNAIEALEKGLQEQQRVGKFDQSLAQSTVEYVAKILGLYIGGISG